MLTVSEITAAGSALFSVGTLFIHLWGSKKDRINGELTAEKLSIEAANNVRIEMEGVIQRRIEGLETELRELKSERKEWESERRQMVTLFHDSEKARLVAEGQRDTAEARLTEMQHRLTAIEARLAELIKPAA